MSQPSASIPARIALIGERGKELIKKLATIGAERARHSLAATEGNDRALDKIRELDEQAAQVEREQITLGAALEQLERMHVEEQRAQAESAVKAREAEARAVADQVLDCSGLIDDRMDDLVNLFEKRSELLRQLGSTKIVPSSYLLRLQQKFASNCAARASGLHKFIPIEHVPVSQVCRLRDSARALKGPLLAIDRASAEVISGDNR
jgi:hypothetical protein